MTRLADEVRDRVSSTAPDRRRPWDRWPRQSGPDPGFSSARWAGAAAVVVVVAILVGPSLLHTTPTPSAALGTTAAASPAASVQPGFAMLGTEELVTAVRGAGGPTSPGSAGLGVGRIVIADVTFAAGGSCASVGAGDLPSRPGSPDPASCYPVLEGSDPPIRLVGPVASHFCGPTAFCLQEGPPVPRDGPFVLRIQGDGAIHFIGWAVRPPNGEPAWTVANFGAWIELPSPVIDRFMTDLELYGYYAVSGWISGEGFYPVCYGPLITGDPLYGCSGRAAVLTTSQIQPNVFAGGTYTFVVPADAIRLQNGAYAEFAPSATRPDAGSLPEGRFGTFLVRAKFCRGCDRYAFVDARLDPP